MIYNDTSSKSGIIQDIEQWTNLGDGIISGDSTQLKLFTSKVNLAYDEVLPILYANDATWQWDDFNHATTGGTPTRPVATTDIISGQASYSFITDEQGNSVLSISDAFLKGPDGLFNRLGAVDPHSQLGADAILAENASNIGTPNRYDKADTSLTLDPVPNYDMTDGLKVVFTRAPNYFASSDTTKTPGIPLPGQRLLSLIPSRDWLSVHEPDGFVLKQVLQLIADQKQALKLHMSRRDKDARRRMQGARVQSV